MNSINKVELFVVSTDSYEDVWDHFFFFLSKYWKNIPFHVTLLTEKKKYENISMQVKCMNINGDNWSDVVVGGLNNLESEFVIFMLDDMFLDSEVNNNMVINALKIIENNQKISCITLGGNDNTRQFEPSEYPNMLRVKDRSPFKVTTSPSLWKKETLISILRSGESPWEFERKGSERSYKKRDLFYVLEKPAMTTYHTWIADSAIIRGKWQYDALKWLRSEGRIVDIKARGISFKTHPFVAYLVKIKRFIIKRTCNGRSNEPE
jgi:hypothetical protein